MRLRTRRRSSSGFPARRRSATSERPRSWRPSEFSSPRAHPQNLRRARQDCSRFRAGDEARPNCFRRRGRKHGFQLDSVAALDGVLQEPDLSLVEETGDTHAGGGLDSAVILDRPPQLRIACVIAILWSLLQNPLNDGVFPRFGDFS